jgi:phosphoglycolate phosphatase-like HAD superfamily hydrolase
MSGEPGCEPGDEPSLSPARASCYVHAMDLRYPCLVIDHDDTAVMSTPLMHYPAHVEAMRRLRPGATPIGLEGWILKNFQPGIMGYLEGELGFDERELRESFEVWREFTASMVPAFFPGMLELLALFKRRGGIVVVVSHSEVHMIQRDYRAGAANTPEAAGFEPDLVFGWDDEDRRKPHPYPLLATMERFGLARTEILVLDDLKPGADMAEAAGVDFAAAGWGHAIPEIKAALHGHCRWYFETIPQFAEVLLGPS